MVSRIDTGFTSVLNEIINFGEKCLKTITSAASKIFGSRSDSEYDETDAVKMTEKKVEIVVQRNNKSFQKALKILGPVDGKISFVTPVTPEFKKATDVLRAYFLSNRSSPEIKETEAKEVFVDKRIYLSATLKNIEDTETLQEISTFTQGPQESKQAFVGRINKRGKGISKDVKNKFKTYYRELKLKQPELTRLQAMSSFVDELGWAVKP